MPYDEKITIVDARGYPCPQPVLMAMQEYGKAPDGAALRTLVDTPVQAENVKRAIGKSGGTAEIKEEDDHYVVEIVKVTVEKCEEGISARDETGNPHVIYISSDRMGTGPDELGGILIKAFINTIKDVEPMPSHMVFVNSGVLITSTDSPIIDTLKELENMGVSIISCGTCLNYLERTEQLKVGIISNMFDILDTLTNASRVIAP